MAQYNQQSFLQAGDIITMSYNGHILSAQGFKSSEIKMLPERNSSKPFTTLFQVQSDAYYDAPLHLVHLLSGKYLFCGSRGIKLSSIKTSSCEILFKPIFRCQIAITRQVRVNQEVMISPADPRTRQDNLALVASPFRMKNLMGCEILIKRNEATHFTIKAKNMRSKPLQCLTNLQIYQLNNLQTEKLLSVKEGEQRQITFQKSINQHDSFIQLLKISKLTTELSEEIITYEQEIYIRSFKANKFISIDMMGRVTLREEPNDSSIFSIQAYHQGDLTSESLIKIHHRHTNKYLSTNPNTPVEEFKLLNIFQIRKVSQKRLRDTLFINELSNSLRQEIRKDPQISTNQAKIKIKQLLLQIVKYIYGKVDLDTFLSMGIVKSTLMQDNIGVQNTRNDINVEGVNDYSDRNSHQLIVLMSEEEQNLMGNVGILQILREIIDKLLPTLAFNSGTLSNIQNNHKEIADEHDILLYVMMVTAGVCNRHVQNTRTFIQGIRVYYQAIGHVQGSIQCLYRIFNNNKDHLLALESAEHSIEIERDYGGNKVLVLPSIEVLLSIIVRNNNSPQLRIKIMRLLQCLCLSKLTSETQNIYRHQLSILKAINSQKLANLLLPMKTNQHNDLLISTLSTNNEQELQQIIMWKNKYAAQLSLLQAQFNLFASLCHNQHGSNLSYMKQIISQDVIYRYLKGNLSPEFRETFMRLLIQIYLQNQTPLNSIIIIDNAIARGKKGIIRDSEPSFMDGNSNGLSSRLMVQQNSPYIEMDQLQPNDFKHSKALQKIQNLVLEVTKKSIVNEIIDRSFYMNIKALKKFLQLRILDRKEVNQFKDILIDFVQKFSSHVFLEEEKKSLMIQILKIFCYYQDLARIQFSERFITKLSYLHKPSSQQVQTVFRQFCQANPFLSGDSNLQYNILVPLIREALDYHDQQIFYHATQLFKLVQSRKTLFVASLKEKIVIASDWTNNLYHKVLKIVSLLRTAVDQHKQIKNNNQLALASQQQKINQLLNELNYFFYEWPSQSSKNGISHLSQNMFRELSMYQLITTLLQQNINESSKNPTTTLINVFRTCFNFLLLFIQNNDSNLMLLSEFFDKSKSAFEIQDCGQAKLLYKVLKMPKSTQLIQKSIYDCLIIFLKHNKTPNSYALLSLTVLLTMQSPENHSKKVDRENLEHFVNLLLCDESFSLMLFKVEREKRGHYEQSPYRYTFNFSSSPQDKERYHPSWPLYLMQLSKLLLMIIEHSSDNSKVIQMVREYMSVQNFLLDAFNCNDLLQNIALEELSATLMKKELIKLFLRVHTQTIRSMTNEVESVLGFIQKIHQRILHARNDAMGGSQHLMQELRSGRLSDQGKAIVQMFFNSEKSIKLFASNFNPIYTSIAVYYPFIVRILQTLSMSNPMVDQNESLRKQVDILIDLMFRKFKEIVITKLTHNQYVPHHREYLNAIEGCQQIFRRKVGFNLIYEASEDDQIGAETDIRANEMLFIPQKIYNLVGNFRVSIVSSEKVQKSIYQCLIQIFFSKKLKGELLNSQNQKKIEFSQESVTKCIKLTQNLIDKRQKEYYKFVDNLYGLVQISDAEQNSEVLSKIVKIVAQENEDLSGRKLCQFLSISNSFIQSHMDMVHHNRRSIFQRIKKNPHRAPKQRQQGLGTEDDMAKKGDQIFPKNFIERILKILNAERDAYLNYSAVSHVIREAQTFHLSYELVPESLRIEECLLWFRNTLLLLPLSKKEHTLVIVTAVVQLIKAYGSFLTEFKFRYVSQQLKHKLELCWSILFHSVTGCCMKNILFMIEKQVWNEVNIMLSLDDNYEKNITELDYKPNDLFKKLNPHSLKRRAQNYIEEIQQVYGNSSTLYEKYFPIDEMFPLLPQKAYYSQIKKWTIAFLKQFKLLPPRLAYQFLTRVKATAIDRNIIETWQKHQNFFRQYDIGSVEVDLIYKENDEKYEVAKNMDFENAVDLCSIKIYIENSSGNGQLEAEYKGSRIDIVNSHKIQSAFTSVITFITDLCLLLISCLLPFCVKPKKRQKKDVQSIMKFFFTKIGRIQIINNNSLFTTQFLIRPECKVNKAMHDKFLGSINFISVQLKLESIIKNTQYFILFFSNQIRYYSKFHNWRVMRFLDLHFSVLKFIAFILITIQNLMLIINSSTNAYFTNLDFTQPFMILQVINMFITYTVLLSYFLKDVPLLVSKVDLQLARRAQSYGSNYKNYSPLTKFLIRGSKILFDPTMMYHLLYTLGVSLILYNKLFSSLVLLDIFFQIPTLRNLLNAIWRPKVDLLLAIVSFTLIQYFFSILMFFGFPNQTLGFCATLGSCFGFVFVTTYKAVGGFVGYLFQQQEQAGTITSNVTFFDIFQDIYVVLIFQIFFALILSIIIDNFTQIRTEQNIRKENLQSNCIVCTLDRSLFNVSSKINFKGHIAINHSIWVYFYYYQYILKKDPLFRSHFEREIYENRNADFLPNGFAKGIKEPNQDLTKQILKVIA